MAPRIADLNIVEVWSALGGGPLQRGRGRAFWRGGDGFNVEIYPRTGTWRDHRAGEGGGILRLIELALGCDRRVALAWLADNFGIAMLERTPEERRAWQRKRQLAEAAAAALAARTEAHLADLQLACGMLLRRYHGLMDEAYRHQEIDLVARAEAVYSKLEELTARRDFLRRASAAEVAAFFAGLSKAVAA